MAKKIWVGRSDRNFILFWNFISWNFSQHQSDVWNTLLTDHMRVLWLADLNFRINHGRIRSFSIKMWRFTLISMIVWFYKEKIASKDRWKLPRAAILIRRTGSKHRPKRLRTKIYWKKFFFGKFRKNFVESAEFFWLGRDIGNIHFFFFGFFLNKRKSVVEQKKW